MARVARGGALNLFGALVTGLCNFVLAVVLTRGLSKPDVGVFFSVSSLFLLGMAVCQLGTNTGLVYFLSRCRAQGRLGDGPSYVRAAARPVLACGALMAAVLFVLAPEVAQLTNPDHADRTVAYLRGVALFIPLAGIEAVALSATRGLGTMRPYALVEMIARPVLQLLLVAATVYLSLADWIGWVWAAPYVPATVAALWSLRTLMRRQVGSGTPDRRVGPEFWRYTSPRAGTSVIQMATQRLDIVLVGALAGAASAAVYAATTRFIVVGQMGNNAISLAAQPALAVALGRDDKIETHNIYQMSTAWLMALSWPLYLTLAVFGETFLRVFGHGYTDGAGVLLTLSVAMLVASGFGMVDMLLSMAGHTAWNLGNAFVALVVQVAVDLFLIPSHGILGAALGWAAAILVRNVAALLQVSLLLRLHPFGTPTAVCAVVCLATYGALAGAMRWALGDGVDDCVAALSVATAVYLVCLWTFRRRLGLDSFSSVLKRRRGAPGSR